MNLPTYPITCQSYSIARPAGVPKSAATQIITQLVNVGPDQLANMYDLIIDSQPSSIRGSDVNYSIKKSAEYLKIKIRSNQDNKLFFDFRNKFLNNISIWVELYGINFGNNLSAKIQYPLLINNEFEIVSIDNYKFQNSKTDCAYFTLNLKSIDKPKVNLN